MKRLTRPLAIAAALAAAQLASAATVVYEGELRDAGRPANGLYDLRITAYGAAHETLPKHSPWTFPGVEVRDGRFRLEWDVPGATDAPLWIELAVRAFGEPGFTRVPGRSKAATALLIGACWSTTGDSGSNPAVNFLGTTDAQPFVLRTRNAQSLRVEPSAETSGGLPITANLVAGSRANAVIDGARGGAIGGGGAPTGDDPSLVDAAPNVVSDHYGTIGGGYANQAGDGNAPASTAPAATVSGGGRNRAIGPYASVGGGLDNEAAGEAATVGGGLGNAAPAVRSTVAGGWSNVASGAWSHVAGGAFNSATGQFGAVGGGSGNCAGGGRSWAGGYRAKVRPGSTSGAPGFGCSGVPASGDANGDFGTFVWADGQDADFVSTGDHQFLIRAQGGVAINTATPAAGAALTVDGGVVVEPPGALGFGSVARQMLNLWSTQYGIGVQSDTLYARSNQSFAWFRNGAHDDAQFNPGSGGSLLMTLTPGPSGSSPTGTARAQSFVNVSDRNRKTGFASVDPESILARLIRMPVMTWSYRDEERVRHLGPTAQDFRAAFGLGEDDRTISTVDAGGVALAAIQGLHRQLERERDRLRAENTSLRADAERLRARLAEVEARLDRLAGSMGR